MAHKKPHHVIGNTENILSCDDRQFLENMFNEERNIFFAIAKRREFQFYDAEAVEQIFTKGPLRLLLTYIKY